MPGLPVGKKATTLSLTAEYYQKLKKLIAPKPISEEIDEFIKRRIAELEGRNPSIVDREVYADLKRQHNKFLTDGDAIKKKLERLEVYDQLIDLADSLGLDFDDLHNADEVAPKILLKWGSRTQAHQFITLMEISRELRKIERRLTEIRSQNEVAGETVEAKTGACEKT